jgi:hypothetical protein
MKIGSWVLATAILLCAETASAQYGRSGYSGGPGGYRRPGYANTNLGPYVMGAVDLSRGINGDLQGEAGAGLGLGGAFGVRFNPIFAFEGSVHDTAFFDAGKFNTMVNFEVAAKLFVPSPGRTDIYLRIGGGLFGFQGAEAAQGSLRGLGNSIGVGYDIRVGNRFFGLEGRINTTRLFNNAEEDFSLVTGSLLPHMGVHF